MKKILCMFAAAVLALTTALAFVGCGTKTPNDENSLEIYMTVGGYGSEWVENLIPIFEEQNPGAKVYLETEIGVELARNKVSAGSSATTADLFISLEDWGTLIMQGENGVAGYDYALEDLTDFLDEEDADGNTLRNRFYDNFLTATAVEVQMSDNTYQDRNFVIPYMTGVLGIVYNKVMFDKYGWDEDPNTTDELLDVCDQMIAEGIVPFENEGTTGYIDYMTHTLFAQYLGNDEYYDYFSPTTEDDWVNYSAEYGSKASLYTMQVMNQVENPSYGRMNPYVTEDGYERVQGRLISGEGAMSINGDWFDNEMGGTIEQANSKEKIYESGMMKFPVISALSDQLSYWETILPGKDYQSACSDVPACTAGLEACDELLSLLVDYVDGGMQGELPSIQYSGQTITATEADAERVAEARSCYTSLGGGHTMVIPAYATAKELAKEFIRLCFSETGIDVFMDVSKGALLPVKYDMESWDGYSSATQFEKDIYDIAKDGTAIQHSSTVNWLVSGLPSPMSNVKFFQYKVTDSGYISPEKYFEQNSLDRAGFLDIMRQAGLL